MRTAPKSPPTADHTAGSWQVPRQERAARRHPQPLLAAEPLETLDIADERTHQISISDCKETARREEPIFSEKHHSAGMRSTVIGDVRLQAYTSTPSVIWVDHGRQELSAEEPDLLGGEFLVGEYSVFTQFG